MIWKGSYRLSSSIFIFHSITSNPNFSLVELNIYNTRIQMRRLRHFNMFSLFGYLPISYIDKSPLPKLDPKRMKKETFYQHLDSQ